MMKQLINEKFDKAKKEVKKVWKKPTILTISEKELSEYIKAAARSGACTGGYSR